MRDESRPPTSAAPPKDKPDRDLALSQANPADRGSAAVRWLGANRGPLAIWTTALVLGHVPRLRYFPFA